MACFSCTTVTHGAVLPHLLLETILRLVTKDPDEVGLATLQFPQAQHHLPYPSVTLLTQRHCSQHMGLNPEPHVTGPPSLPASISVPHRQDSSCCHTEKCDSSWNQPQGQQLLSWEQRPGNKQGWLCCQSPGIRYSRVNATRVSLCNGLFI